MGECVVVDLEEYKKIKNGCVLIAREIDKSPVMNCAPVVREVWFYLLRKVTHKDIKKFNRGQGFFNIPQIKKDLSWMQGNSTRNYNYKQIQRAIKSLVENQSITTTRGKTGFVITITNYDYYQTMDNYENSIENNANRYDSVRQKKPFRTGYQKTLQPSVIIKNKTDKKIGTTKKQNRYNSVRDISYINRQECKTSNKRIADFDESATQKFYHSKSGKKLTEKRLETFYQFWDSFDFKQGKAAAADSWLKIPALNQKLVKQILSAAKIEASGRQKIINKGGTPKWAQGWITERRWEDEIYKKSKLISKHESKKQMKNEIKDMLS